MSRSSVLTLGTFEAKNRLSYLVDLASKGSQIWITKRGKRVALLSSGEEKSREAKDLVASFREIRKGSKTGRESLKSLIEENRR